MFKRILRFILSLLTLFLSLFIRREQKMLAFGSWKGELYIDNSRYLFEYVYKNYADFKCVWVGTKAIRALIPSLPNVVFVQKDSIRATLYLLRCKYMFCSQMHNDDLCSYNVFRKAIITYLHHGMPLKKWGSDSAEGHKNFIPNGFKKVLKKIDSSFISYDFFTVSSSEHSKTNVSSLDYRGCTLEKCLPYGTPRNDFLIANRDNADFINKLKRHYAELLGFDCRNKIMMYLPTYRRKNNNVFSFLHLKQNDLSELNKILNEHNYILIEKSHFAAANINDKASRFTPSIFQANVDVNVQEMLLFTDVLISDYSGAFLDFLLLNRPVIHYVYDYSFYSERDSGLYYNLDEFASGDTPSTFEQLLNSITDAVTGKDAYFERRKLVFERFMKYENGTASKSLFKKIVLGEN